MTELTVSKLVNAISDIEANQTIINQACAAAFTGRNVKAPKDSVMHKALVQLIKARDAFNKAHQAANDIVRSNAKVNNVKPVGVVKYQGLNILASEITRWVNKVNRNAKYNGLRASIKATGGASKFSVALVQTAKAQADSKGDAAGTSKSKAKQLTNLMNDSSISLDEALAALVDTYTLDCVKASLAKLS